MSNFNEIGNEIIKIFPEAEEFSAGEYADLKYPKFMPTMRFKVRRFNIKDFGHMAVVDSNLIGVLRLVTVSFTPNKGKSVPYLLLDVMSIGKRRIVLAEFYDCTEGGTEIPQLKALKEDYASVPEYSEKQAWYVSERMEGSLIKCSTPDDEEKLSAMVLDAVSRYADAIKTAGTKPGNIDGLRKFCDRMVEDGNPSTSTLEKVLGKEGGAKFFRSVVMPMD